MYIIFIFLSVKADVCTQDRTSLWCGREEQNEEEQNQTKQKLQSFHRYTNQTSVETKQDI